jgi:ferric-dicitrate binding protein FerR (iron transport regulator)
MNRAPIRTCLLAFAAILLLPALAAGQSAAPSALSKDRRMALAAHDDVAVIVYCEGLVKAGGVQVDIGSRITNGTTITTGPDAFAEIVFGQKNILRIAPGSMVRLELAGLQRQLTLDQGAVGAVLRRLEKAAGGSLTVRTPSSVAAVRGTTLFAAVDAEAPDMSYYCICNGRLELADPDGTNTAPLAASHHHAVERQRTPAGPVDKAGPLKGHDDASVEALVARIGETMDWTKIEE